MQTIEVWQRQEHVAVERLEAAAGIARAVAQHDTAHAIGDARLKFLEARRLAADALAGNHSDAGCPASKRLNQLGEEGRIVLAVAVEGHDSGALACATPVRNAAD